MNNTLFKEVNIKLDEIASIIGNIKNTYSNGLYTGRTGIALFCMYYYNFCKKRKYYNLSLKLLTEDYNSINKDFTLHTFCSGIGGLCWTLEHLKKKNFLTFDSHDFLFYIEKYLIKKMFEELEENNNYDFLHGAIGIGFSLLNRPYNSKRVLADLINALNKKGIAETEKTLKFLSTVNGANYMYKEVVNLSLSHGMAIIIVFLAKVYNKNISKKIVREMIIYIINYYIKHKQDYQMIGSYFSSWVDKNENNEKSRLAWCYGDLGIANAFYIAGKLLNENKWINLSVEILINSANRRDLVKEGVSDAGFCHGTSGISHIYRRMFRNTGIEIFKETADFWLIETLKKAGFKDGLAGYKSIYVKKDGGGENEYNLIEGIAGIGLVLLSSLSEEVSSWDECFLLS